jgi:hypothetical protein
MATVLRPMNAGELLDRTFFLYRKHFIVLVALVALPQLVLLMLQLAHLAVKSSAIQVSAMLWNLTIIAVNLLLVAFSQAATVIAVSDVHLGKQANIGNAFAGAKDCLLEIIVISIFVGLGLFFGFLLLIVPGVILALAWSLAVPVAVIEKEGPLDAIPRSARLTKGNRSRIFVILLLVLVFKFVVALIFQVPIFFFTGLSTLLHPQTIPSWVNAYSLIAGFLSSSLVVPISTIATALIYYDLRVRKEGFDLQFMMSSLKSSMQKPPETSAVS